MAIVVQLVDDDRRRRVLVGPWSDLEAACRWAQAVADRGGLHAGPLPAPHAGAGALLPPKVYDAADPLLAR